MLRTRFIVIAWLLLLVPTLLIGGMALRLLGNEQQRVAAESREAARRRAMSAAESFDLAIAEVRDGLLAGLRRLPEVQLADRLEQWKDSNPLIRNVFIAGPDGLLLPDPQAPSSREESEFIDRYDALFRGRIPWRGPDLDVPGQVAAASPRNQLRRLTQGAAGENPRQETSASGWIPWFWEDGLYLLGWIERPAGSGRHVGLEMEMMALLSRLIVAMPAPRSGETWVLVDGHGRAVHQSGSGALEPGSAPYVTQSLGAGLPHWELRIYRSAVAPGGTGGLRLLSGLLVGSFVAAILFGGSLLLWQAWRNMRDARRKTTFVSNVSHELKTPLTTIRLYAELLAEGHALPEQRQRHYLRVIVEESQRLTRLVNNVLDFGRLEQGRKKYHVRDFSPADCLDEVLDSQQLRLEQAGMRLLRSGSAQIPEVRADRDAVRQALLNLIDNALKYAAGGKELAVRLDQIEQRCRITVMDRGPGVPVAHRDRIFEQFHRVDDALTAACPGSGLGLSIARRLLRDMGGDLRYQPRPDGGACFEMLVPLASGASEATAANAPSSMRR
jgi:signal transduction histidine kinase